MIYTTYKVAEMTGVTLRALRYYDKIGLLQPSGRSEAGYRLYNGTDLEMLQQIMFFKELDFPLAKIAEILKSPDFDRQAALEMQIDFLEKKSERYSKLSQLARDTLLSVKGENNMEKEELFTGFDYDKMMEEQKQYEDEVKQRWGESDAYKVSCQRAAKYTKEDWEGINLLQQENMQELAACFKEQIPFDAPRMQSVVEKARLHIDRYFYPCTPEMMSGLGDMYVADPRFKKTYDEIADGLAEYYNKAIQYYCKQSGKDQ